MTQEKRIWLARDRALFLGELPPTRLHAHAAPVLLIGMSGPITLHFTDGRSETCHSALVDTGVEHGLDSGGEYLASLYLEPDAPETRILKANWLNDCPVVYDPMSAARHKTLERRLQSFDLSDLLPASALAAGSDKYGDLTIDEVMGISGFLGIADELAALVSSDSYSYSPDDRYGGVTVTVLEEVVIDGTTYYQQTEVNLLDEVVFNTVPTIEDNGYGIDTFTQQADDAVQVLEYVHDFSLESE